MVKFPVCNGLAYAVVRAPLAPQPPTPLKKISVALESILRTEKNLGVPAGARFEVTDLRAGTVQAMVNAGSRGKFLARRMLAFEGQEKANFIIRASVPEVSNDAAAASLGEVMALLSGAGSREIKVLAILYVNDAGVAICNLEPIETW